MLTAGDCGGMDAIRLRPGLIHLVFLVLSPSPQQITIKLRRFLSIASMLPRCVSDSYNAIKGQVFIYLPAPNRLLPMCVCVHAHILFMDHCTLQSIKKPPLKVSACIRDD